MLLRAFALPLLFGVACRRPPSPPHADAAAPRPPRDVGLGAPADVAAAIDAAAPDAPADAPVAYRIAAPDGAVAAARDGGRRAPRPTAVAARAAGDAWGPAALAATATGAVHVRALNREGARTTEVVATALDRDGRPVGPARLLRRTTGPVAALSASAAGAHLWTSWITLRELAMTPRGEARWDVLSAGLHASADLATVDAPVTFENAEARGAPDDLRALWWERPVTRAFAREDGGALVVATGGTVRCVHSHDPTGARADDAICAVWSEFRVGADGALATRAERLLAPFSPPGGFARVPGGVLYAVGQQHVTVTSGAVLARYDGAAAAARIVDDSVYFQADLRFAWTGEGVVARGRLGDVFGDPDVDSEPRLASFDGSGALRSPSRVNGAQQTVWAPHTVAPLRCVGGHPAVTLRWRGGAITLDPTRADQHVDLAAWAEGLPLPPAPNAGTDAPRVTDLAWAGRALVGVVDGQLTRWTCAASGRITLAP